MSYKLSVKKPHTAILIKLISLASIGATLFTPGIPAIRTFFHISEGEAQSALTLFMLGYALGQILYSPFANRFGRKKTIHAGLVIAMIGSLLSILSGPFHSFALLIASRLITAIGASSGLVLTITIINDYYHEHQARKVVPIVSTAFAIVPFIGVAIGGVLVHSFGWQSTFFFLLLYYLIVLVFTTRLPETGTNLSREETRLKVICQRYGQAFSDRRLVFFSVLFGLIGAMIYIYAETAPLIAIDTLKINPQNYGFINLVVALFYVMGNLVAASLNKRFSAVKMIWGGLLFFGLPFLVLFSFLIAGHVSFWTFFVPLFIAYFGYPIAFSNVIVLASHHFEDKATGSAIMNFINMTVAMGGTVLMQNLPGPLTISMPAMMVGLSVLFFILFLYAKRFVNNS
ncbi:MAG: MFS transporter [Chlamydiales bacterium]|nr:MFS transporter [Chlamydiales bacterium]